MGRTSHVAFVIPNLAGGGAERNILNIVSGLISYGHRVDLLLFKPEIDYALEIPERARLFLLKQNSDRKRQHVDPDVIGRFVQLDANLVFSQWIRIMNALKWNLLAASSRRLFRLTAAVAMYLERENPDYIFPNLSDAKVTTLLARNLVPACPPVIPIVHSVMDNRSIKDRIRYRLLFSRASHCVAVSEGVADSVSAVIGVPKEKLTTIYNPVLTRKIETLSADVPNHPWLTDGGPPIVLGVGRLAEVKDFPNLIRAFSQLSKERPCRLIILGQGNTRPQLEDLVRTLKLDDRVSLPGWVDNPYAFMSRAALFVLSSKHEGLAMVLLEALACGCPCVSTDCPAGPAEILEDGKWGDLVPVGDETALANAMRRTLDQPPDKEALRSRARMFSLDRAVQSYTEVMAKTKCP